MRQAEEPQLRPHASIPDDAAANREANGALTPDPGVRDRIPAQEGGHRKDCSLNRPHGRGEFEALRRWPVAEGGLTIPWVGGDLVANVIEVSGLTRLYGNRRGVTGLEFVVAAGEVFGFLGPNGAGKTTTIRLLLGAIRPTSGGLACSAWTHGLIRRPPTGGSPTSAATRGSSAN